MVITFPFCKVLGVESFTSKKGTACGVLRFFDQTEGMVYRTMVFGEDVGKLAGVQQGQEASVSLAVQGSRRDDSIELYLSEVTQAGV